MQGFFLCVCVTGTGSAAECVVMLTLVVNIINDSCCIIQAIVQLLWASSARPYGPER